MNAQFSITHLCLWPQLAVIMSEFRERQLVTENWNFARCKAEFAVVPTCSAAKMSIHAVMSIISDGKALLHLTSVERSDSQSYTSSIVCMFVWQ